MFTDTDALHFLRFFTAFHFTSFYFISFYNFDCISFPNLSLLVSVVFLPVFVSCVVCTSVGILLRGAVGFSSLYLSVLLFPSPHLSILSLLSRCLCFICLVSACVCVGILLHGPPGVGKTTAVQKGQKSVQRKGETAENHEDDDDLFFFPSICLFIHVPFFFFVKKTQKKGQTHPFLSFSFSLLV